MTFYALKTTVLVSPVSPVTTLGIIQCGHQELIFLPSSTYGCY